MRVPCSNTSSRLQTTIPAAFRRLVLTLTTPDRTGEHLVRVPRYLAGLPWTTSMQYATPTMPLPGAAGVAYRSGRIRGRPILGAAYVRTRASSAGRWGRSKRRGARCSHAERWCARVARTGEYMQPIGGAPAAMSALTERKETSSDAVVFSSPRSLLRSGPEQLASPATHPSPHARTTRSAPVSSTEISGARRCPRSSHPEG